MGGWVGRLVGRTLTLCVPCFFFFWKYLVIISGETLFDGRNEEGINKFASEFTSGIAAACATGVIMAFVKFGWIFTFLLLFLLCFFILVLGLVFLLFCLY